MPRLEPPSVHVADSFRAAMNELAAEGRGAEDDESMVGWEIRTFGPTWSDPGGFATFVAALQAQAAEEDAARPAHIVPCTTWWWVEGVASRRDRARRRGAGGRTPRQAPLLGAHPRCGLTVRLVRHAVRR